MVNNAPFTVSSTRVGGVDEPVHWKTWSELVLACRYCTFGLCACGCVWESCCPCRTVVDLDLHDAIRWPRFLQPWHMACLERTLRCPMHSSASRAWCSRLLSTQVLDGAKRMCAVRRRGESTGKSMSDLSVAKRRVCLGSGRLCKTVDVEALLRVPLPCPAVVVPWLGSRLTLWPVPLRTHSVASGQSLQVVCAVFSDRGFRRQVCPTAYPGAHRQNYSAPTVSWVLHRMWQQILQRGESAKKIWSAGRPVMASGDSVQLRAWRARRRVARAASSLQPNYATARL